MKVGVIVYSYTNNTLCIAKELRSGLIQKGYIDPLSLYLSLKDDIDTEDTRVTDAFTTLEEIIKGCIRDSRDR